MSITEELRKYAGNLASLAGASTAAVKSALEGIADRIDKAHDEELMQAKAEVLADCISVANDFIELPKDADGKTIRVGDRLDGYNKTIEVVELRYGRSGWVLISREGNGYADMFAFTHAKPDSWERIIEDAAKNIYPNGAFNPCWDEVSAELVERCKRLAGEDA